MIFSDFLYKVIDIIKPSRIIVKENVMTPASEFGMGRHETVMEI